MVWFPFYSVNVSVLKNVGSVFEILCIQNVESNNYAEVPREEKKSDICIVQIAAQLVCLLLKVLKLMLFLQSLKSSLKEERGSLLGTANSNRHMPELLAIFKLIHQFLGGILEDVYIVKTQIGTHIYDMHTKLTRTGKGPI